MTVYEIRIKGQLDQHWSVWFDGMMVTHGTTMVTRSSLGLWWIRPLFCS